MSYTPISILRTGLLLLGVEVTMALYPVRRLIAYNHSITQPAYLQLTNGLTDGFQ